MKNALVDFRISETEEKNLNKIGYNCIKCPPSEKLLDAVKGHPDMLLNVIDNKNIIVHKDMESGFVNLLKDLKKNVYYSEKSLSKKYPSDIILNALNGDSCFVHNLKYSDKNLLKFFENKAKINVKQGYTKCSTAVVSEKAAITSDKGIGYALRALNFDVLLLPPGDILLPGMNYGFIGGTCGLASDNKMIFYGNLNNYIYGKEIIKFLNKYNIAPIYLSDEKLIDRGSIFFI